MSGRVSGSHGRGTARCPVKVLFDVGVRPAGNPVAPTFVAPEGTTPSPPEPLPEPALGPMLWNAQGTTETGFRRKCFAKADWAHLIEIDADQHFIGEFRGTHLRMRELEQILLAVQAVMERQQADDQRD